MTRKENEIIFLIRLLVEWRKIGNIKTVFMLEKLKKLPYTFGEYDEHGQWKPGSFDELCEAYFRDEISSSEYISIYDAVYPHH